MSDYESIDTFERDGWNIDVSIAPDYDYRPGEDDDIYPVLEAIPSGYYDEDDRDYDGRYMPQPIIVDTRGGPAMVSSNQIDELAEKWGTPRAKARKMIESDARAIGNESLSWVVIRVRASRGTISGTDYLGGVEYDLRQNPPEKYALETVEHYGMVETAIEDAARSVAGTYATLALSY